MLFDIYRKTSGDDQLMVAKAIKTLDVKMLTMFGIELE
jgi:hypothetical protein